MLCPNCASLLDSLTVRSDPTLYKWLYRIRMEKFYANFLDEEIDFDTLKEPGVGN